MKKSFFILSLLLIILFFGTGCTESKGKNMTISVNTESEYVNTFKDLSLGILWDFNFTLPQADERWVQIWVDSYIEGNIQSEPIISLSYGQSPNMTDEGHLGLGLLNYDSDSPSIFLYAPNVKTSSKEVELLAPEDLMRSWSYAVGEDEELELKIGETYVLGAYRESTKNGMRTYDLQDEDQIEFMLNDDDHTLLLKIKIEENSERFE